MGTENIPLDRGYDRFELKLQSLGAEVERLPESEFPKAFLIIRLWKVSHERRKTQLAKW